MKQLALIIGLILGIFFWLVPLLEKEKEIKVVTFETTMGPIVIELFEDCLLYTSPSPRDS